jgi:SAM (Sterile alpha motif) domain-containing protein/adenylate/guanylate cyclase family protein
MDVAEWLRGLGLGQYAPAFRENDIDGEVLHRLTSDDLRELGVKSIGHRRRLLDAIAVLTAGGKAPDVWTAPPPGPEPQAERRRLTVMFCDLVGSTGLSARLDPEDLREVIRGYHRAVADTVARFAGFVAKYMGDDVLAYFGYPQAHEDDAERAVRAGLGVIEAVGRLDVEGRALDRPDLARALDLTVERLRSLPVLLIVTFRRKFQPPWTGQPRVRVLVLNRLDRHDSGRADRRRQGVAG